MSIGVAAGGARAGRCRRRGRARRRARRGTRDDAGAVGGGDQLLDALAQAAALLGRESASMRPASARIAGAIRVKGEPARIGSPRPTRTVVPGAAAGDAAGQLAAQARLAHARRAGHQHHAGDALGQRTPRRGLEHEQLALATDERGELAEQGARRIADVLACQGAGAHVEAAVEEAGADVVDGHRPGTRAQEGRRRGR
jgi:hypothetical protein